VDAVLALLLLVAGMVGILLVVRGLAQIERPRAGPSREWPAINSRGAARAGIGLIVALVGYLTTGLWMVLGWIAIPHQHLRLTYLTGPGARAPGPANSVRPLDVELVPAARAGGVDVVLSRDWGVFGFSG
jgi:hypothetical protein